MFRRRTLASLAILALAAGAGHADIPGMSRFPIEETITPHASGGATGACSIVYYNLCRWLNVWSDGGARWEVGVVFDLPLDCGKLPGEACENTGFWWYWRYTCPNYGYTLTYDLYNLDAEWCKLGAPLGTIANQDPTERWNHFPSLGGPIMTDRTAIIATYDKGGLPYLATDNNVNDLADPTNCPGYVPHTVVHSVSWGVPGYFSYCPPHSFEDDLGPVEIIMDASFSCGVDAAKPESWSGLKKLFR